MENAYATQQLVLDRHNALEAAARRERLVNGARPARRFTLRRRSNAAHADPVPAACGLILCGR